ncbi:MAG: hypothetical protein WC076_12955 [Terrimicrobiaceae bacterium]|jgi:hypothetical protein
MAEKSTALRIRLLHALSRIAELPGTDSVEALFLALETGRRNLSFEKATLGRLDANHLLLEACSPPADGGQLSYPL